MPTFLALSGSLRAGSTNQILLRVLADRAPANVAIRFYDGLSDMPLFSPELDGGAPPEAVLEFRRQLQAADGVVICTPEYAFGIPGALKNALDWTVGSGEFSEKSVALITASALGERGHQALLWVLEALGARVVPGGALLISGVRSKVSAQHGVTDPTTLQALTSVLDALVRHLEPA